MTASAPDNLGLRLQRALDVAGMSLDDAAKLLRVDANTVAIWTAGLEPPPTARPAVERFIADCGAGRTPRQQVVRLFGRIEDERHRAAAIDQLTRERGRLSRLLFRHVDVVAEKSCLAHEAFKLGIVAMIPDRIEDLASQVDTAYAAVIDNLELMLDVARHLREQSRDALDARLAERNVRCVTDAA